MTICNGGIRLVELEILMVMIGQKDNGKSKDITTTINQVDRYPLQNRPLAELKMGMLEG
jgi:hypothetical protein